MNQQHLGLFALVVVTLVSGIFYMNSEPASCFVKGAAQGVNGYYFAHDGYYIQMGHSSGRTLLDVFDLVYLRNQVNYKYMINLSNAGWGFFQTDTKRFLYESLPPAKNAEVDSLPLYHPQAEGWIHITYGENGKPLHGDLVKGMSVVCTGGLYDAHPAGPPSNLSTASKEAGTWIILGSIVYFAWYLYSTGVEVPAVSYSYGKVVHEGEYWRCITASFSHFDLMHLGFNGMTLYQMAILETQLGTIKYFYLSMDLVVITMVLCTAMYWVMIYRLGREEQIQAQAVGYSCVLFAWIVVVSVKMEQFCPIFFLPSFCFETYRFDYLGGMPLNLGPIVLLVITKFILPRSSFVGHLSGIIIGMPLAWGWLDWLTPPVLISSMLALWVAGKGLDVRKYAAYSRGFGGSSDYTELQQSSAHSASGDNGGNTTTVQAAAVAEDAHVIFGGVGGVTSLFSEPERIFLEGALGVEMTAEYFYLKKVCGVGILWNTFLCLYGLAGLVAAGSGGPEDTPRLLAGAGLLLTRGLLVFFLWSAPHAKRVSILSDNAETIKDCLLLIVLAMCYSALLAVQDLLGLVMVIADKTLVDAVVANGAWVLALVLVAAAMAEGTFCAVALASLRTSPPVELGEVLRRTCTDSIIRVE